MLVPWTLLSGTPLKMRSWNLAHANVLKPFRLFFFFNIYQTSKINGMLQWRQQDVLAELVQRGHICQTWQDMTWRFCSSNRNLFYLVSFQNIHIILSLWYSTFQRDEIQFLTPNAKIEPIFNVCGWSESYILVKFYWPCTGFVIRPVAIKRFWIISTFVKEG